MVMRFGGRQLLDKACKTIEERLVKLGPMVLGNTDDRLDYLQETSMPSEQHGRWQGDKASRRRRALGSARLAFALDPGQHGLCVWTVRP